MSLDEAEKWAESTMNLIGITRGGKTLSKSKIPVHEKFSIALKVLSIILIITGIIGLNLSGVHH